MSRDREETESVPRAIEPARNRTRPKRNGASLAADPTLTGVWTPEGVLDARRLQYCPKAASLSPGARAGAGSAGDRTIARTRSELPGGTATGCHPFLPRSVPPRPKIRLCHRHELLKVRPVDFAPSRLHGLDGLRLGRTLGAFLPSLYRAAFAVASKRFRNPFSAAGLSAFVSEGPIPVSTSEGCMRRPIRATAEQASYPPLPGMPVDKGG